MMPSWPMGRRGSASSRGRRAGAHDLPALVDGHSTAAGPHPASPGRPMVPSCQRKAWDCPKAVALTPTTCPRSLMANAPPDRAESPPSVPRSGHGAVLPEEGVRLLIRGSRASANDLPALVDGGALAKVPPASPDRSWLPCCQRNGVGSSSEAVALVPTTCPTLVDGESTTEGPAQRPQVDDQGFL